MTALALFLAFLVFMLTVGSVYAINRYALARFAYVPFSLPNAAFMLIPNGLWLAALALARHDTQLAPMLGGDIGLLPLLVVSCIAAVWMFLVISRRTNGWIGAYAVSLLWIGAVVLVFTIGFWTLAISGQDRR
ncbi:MAG: hypothetical protein WCA32_01065 [Chromatiaceae bacterium]